MLVPCNATAEPARNLLRLMKASGHAVPASPFLKSGVEEVNSTVCDLWEKNGSKVLSSLNDASLPTNSIIDAERTKASGTFPSSGPSANGNLLLILNKLAKISATQSEAEEMYPPQSLLCFSTSATNSPSTSYTTTSSTTLDDGERWQLGDGLLSNPPLKVETPSYARSNSKRRAEKSRNVGGRRMES
ncbi:hypothetical protein CORC01_12979 [Colletotrichum orchidophilum]|uniref:Uncharacterized protein n=1 Tax=Colletotrichum orchidophilum TaxID=1209926 RepID=A0A1G4ARV4_9PEZI|nr:uncharacterized protein CORC01_12979 [Colletotrichum orchidophilum]OHE91752.1 hypothetical protein CORC01_12979 [Colletotrichum orchidophilum]